MLLALQLIVFVLGVFGLVIVAPKTLGYKYMPLICAPPLYKARENMGSPFYSVFWLVQELHLASL